MSSRRVVDSADAKTGAGTKLVNGKESGSGKHSQLWLLSRAELSAGAGGTNLTDATGYQCASAVALAAPLHVEDCVTDNPSQKMVFLAFRRFARSTGRYDYGVLRLSVSGWCLDTGRGAQGAPVVVGNCTGSPSQLWQPIAGSNDYQFLNGASGRYLDLAGGIRSPPWWSSRAR